MLPLAHLGITVFLSIIFYLPALFAAIGALLPDIVDKILFLSGFSVCGRFIGHTIFFGPIASLLTYVLTKNKKIALAILFGCWLHLFEDARDFMPLFYPIVKYQFACLPTSIKIGTFEVITESLGATLLTVTILFKSKIMHLRDKVWIKIKKVIKWRKLAP